MGGSKNTQIEVFSGWKEIANYLGKGVRTVQRYERRLGLPIRRPAGKSSASVIATKGELDAWISASPLRVGFRRLELPADNAAMLKEFRMHLKELGQLRQETAALRQALVESLELLHTNPRFALPEPQVVQLSSQRRVLAEVLSFDSKKVKVR